MARLSGKVAVVTGGSRGIGAAIAKRLAADGATVAVNYTKSEKAAAEVVAQIKAAGGTAAAIQADVAEQEQVKRLFDEVQERHGRVDILVNNAGVFGSQPLAEFKAEDFEAVFKVNVRAAIFAAHEAIRYMPDSGGRIINISSVAARVAMPCGAIYCASKAALDALTANWSVELGSRNITVNSVSPGVTETDMMAGAPAEAIKGFIARTPLGRVGNPRDIADVVAFIASDDARWISGQVIDVSGGLRP